MLTGDLLKCSEMSLFWLNDARKKQSCSTTCTPPKGNLTSNFTKKTYLVTHLVFTLSYVCCMQHIPCRKHWSSPIGTSSRTSVEYAHWFIDDHWCMTCIFPICPKDRANSGQGDFLWTWWSANLASDLLAKSTILRLLLPYGHGVYCNGLMECSSTVVHVMLPPKYNGDDSWWFQGSVDKWSSCLVSPTAMDLFDGTT